jgi:hypothetical protein
MQKPKINSSWLLLGTNSLVLASDAPPATLPKGFLEQLPILESFKDDEFEIFLQFAKNDQAENKDQDHAEQGSQTEEDLNNE